MSGTWCADALLVQELRPRSAATISALREFTDYLTIGGRIEVAPGIAGHSNTKTKADLIHYWILLLK
jgi:hypothetical protein